MPAAEPYVKYVSRGDKFAYSADGRRNRLRRKQDRKKREQEVYGKRRKQWK